MITRETLREYQALENERKNLAARIKKIDQLPEEEQKSMSKIKDAYEKNIEKIVQINLEIEHAIENLTSTERELIRLRYIDGLEWHVVSARINYCWKQTHRIHAKILEKLESMT